VALQVALAVVLLMAGGVFLRSLMNAQRINLGFEPRHVVTASVDPGLHGYSPEAAGRFWERLTPQLVSIPGVESVSLASTVPFELNITRMSIGPEGYQPTIESGWPSVDRATVDADYFGTLAIPLLEGRDFGPSDRDGSPAVAIVNDELARRFWPQASAVGRRLVTPSGVCCQVIGVVRGSRSLTLGEDPKPQIYFAFRQSGARAGTMVLRTSGDERTALDGVRSAVGTLDSTLPLYNVSTMDAHVRVARLPAIASAVAVAIVGLVGLLLTGLGLYGSVAQVVASREKEIGVRRALGAGRGRVLWLVLRQACGLAALGSLAGFGAGLAAARVLRAFVYDVGAGDLLVVAAAPALIALVCAAAAGLPALAALRIDTARALRCE
jgi:predicted permease